MHVLRGSRGQTELDVLRIGDKLISRGKLRRIIDRILEARAAGSSQQEVANQIGTDRTFISRLETLGEVRKGKRVALIGFPIKNKEELLEVARSEGVDYSLIFTDDERWDFLDTKSSVELFNQVLELIGHFREYDRVIFLGSDMRVELVEGILGADSVIAVTLGPSPVTKSVYVDPEAIREIIRHVKGH